MKVLNFNKFNSAIFEYGGEEQNTTSKSGIKYKDNMGIQTKDTGKTAANSCFVFAQNSVNQITKMGIHLSAYSNSGKSTIDIATSGIAALRNSLDTENPSYENNKKYFNGLKDLADRIYTDGKNHEITGVDGKNILDAYIAQLAKLSRDAEYRKNGVPKSQQRGEITQIISHEEIKMKSFGQGTEYPDDKYYQEQRRILKQAYEDQIDKSNILVYNEKMKACKYFQAAVNVFVQGAIVELEHMETEEKASDTNRPYIGALTQKLKNSLR